jgi:DNA topoisomerase IA
LSAGEEKFSIASKRVVDPGFTEVLTWQAVAENEASLEQFAKGSKLAIVYFNFIGNIFYSYFFREM